MSVSDLYLRPEADIALLMQPEPIRKADLLATLQWLEQVANVRVHGTTGERPAQRFDREERVALNSLAPRPYRSLVRSVTPQPSLRPIATPRLEVQRRPLEVYTRLAGGRV